MTKYILNSGGLKNNIPSAKQYVAEMVSGSGTEPSILFCFFAEKREVWEEKFPAYKAGFKEWLPEGISPRFELAFPETFEAQVKGSDILYIHGGDDHLLKHWLEQFDIPHIWKGKVVATNSASTHALSSSYWTCDWRMCKKGFGILPIKTIGHFGSEYEVNDPRGPVSWESALVELREFDNKDLPVHALKEGEFVVFDVDEDNK